jgi:hypothetical protein
LKIVDQRESNMKTSKIKLCLRKMENLNKTMKIHNQSSHPS